MANKDYYYYYKIECECTTTNRIIQAGRYMILGCDYLCVHETKGIGFRQFWGQFRGNLILKSRVPPFLDEPPPTNRNSAVRACAGGNP